MYTTTAQSVDGIPMDREKYLLIIREHMKSSYLLNDEKINTILPDFLAALENHMKTLEEKMSEGAEPASIDVAAHTVKGALLNLGLFELADTAYKIEQKGKQAEIDSDCPSLIAQLKNGITTITGS